MEFVINKELFPREKYLSKIRGFYHECEIIKVITGVRRCGKSSLMNLIIQELQRSGVSQDNILYFNLDKRPYRSLSEPEDLDALIEKYAAAEGKKYLFIDEVQNISGFETVINSWREEGDISIFITGSNSYLLSGELATKLTGRYIEFNVLPLTFDEYLALKAFLHKEVSADSMTELRNYIFEGGFPYTVRLDSIADKRTYVQGLIDEIYQKDIKKRVVIKNRSVYIDIANHTAIKNIQPISLIDIEKYPYLRKYIIKNDFLHHDKYKIDMAKYSADIYANKLHINTLIWVSNQRSSSAEIRKIDKYSFYKYLVRASNQFCKINDALHSALLDFAISKECLWLVPSTSVDNTVAMVHKYMDETSR